MSHGALSPKQFGELYPPGFHSIPVEHLDGLRDSPTPRSGRRMEQVHASVAKEGAILNPLQVVDNRDHGPSLVEGHHRHDAAKLLGMTHVPVHVVDSYFKLADTPRHPDTNRVYDEMWK